MARLSKCYSIHRRRRFRPQEAQLDLLGKEELRMPQCQLVAARGYLSSPEFFVQSPSIAVFAAVRWRPTEVFSFYLYGTVSPLNGGVSRAVPWHSLHRRSFISSGLWFGLFNEKGRVLSVTYWFGDAEQTTRFNPIFCAVNAIAMVYTILDKGEREAYMTFSQRSNVLRTLYARTSILTPLRVSLVIVVMSFTYSLRINTTLS